MPATQSSVTETARYVSVVLIRPHLHRSESEGLRILCALLGFFSGLVHLQRTATQAAASDRCRSLVSLTRIGHLHEGEAPRASVFFVGNDIHAFYSSVGLKQGSQFLFSRAECEIANVKVLHSNSSLCRDDWSVPTLGPLPRSLRRSLVMGMMETDPFMNVT